MYNLSDKDIGKSTVYVVTSDEPSWHVCSVHSDANSAMEAMDLYGHGIAQEYVIDQDLSLVRHEKSLYKGAYYVEIKRHQDDVLVTAVPVPIDGSTVFGLKYFWNSTPHDGWGYGIVMAWGEKGAIKMGEEYVKEMIEKWEGSHG